MKKRVNWTSLIKNPVTKAIPLSVAIAMMSTGNVIASNSTESLNVDMGNGKIAMFDAALIITNEEYRAIVEDALKKAFENGDSIMVKDSYNSNWIDFGTNAKEGISYDIMANETGKALNSGIDEHTHRYIINDSGSVEEIMDNY